MADVACVGAVLRNFQPKHVGSLAVYFYKPAKNPLHNCCLSTPVTYAIPMALSHVKKISGVSLFTVMGDFCLKHGCGDIHKNVDYKNPTVMYF
jgi:hypothetical protein